VNPLSICVVGVEVKEDGAGAVLLLVQARPVKLMFGPFLLTEMLRYPEELSAGGLQMKPVCDWQPAGENVPMLKTFSETVWRAPPLSQVLPIRMSSDTR